jgi:hypothetical protein
MKADVMTQEEVRTRGMDALKRELGTVGMLRFLQHFDRGKGDYTKERHRWLDRLAVDDVLGDVRALRQHKRQPRRATR